MATVIYKISLQGIALRAMQIIIINFLSLYF